MSYNLAGVEHSCWPGVCEREGKKGVVGKEEKADRKDEREKYGLSEGGQGSYCNYCLSYLLVHS